jgi:ABC-2 type transport system permease protein
MHKTWLVIKHEYLTNVKRRSFLFAAFGVPLFTIVMLVIIFALAINNEEDLERLGTIGYVDQAGVLTQQIEKPETFQPFDSEAAVRAALDEGSVGAYFILPPDYMDTGTIRIVGRSDIPEALNNNIDFYLRSNLSTGLDPEIADRISDPVQSSVKTLDNGRVIRENAIVGLFLAPFIFVIVFLIATQTTSGYLMSGVVEEKSNRIMEILVTSITPFQLLFGKIVGLGALGLTQLVIWMVAGAVTLVVGRNTEFLGSLSVPTDLLIVGVIYFLLGYFFLASAMAGIGAVVGSEQESRQFAAIFSIGLSVPFFAIVSFFTDPSGTLVTFLTLFPLTSPVAVILLMGFGTIPTWQLVASIVLLLFTTLFVVWASARVFRWALLLYGKRPGPRELLRVIRRAPSMATSATGDSAP